MGRGRAGPQIVVDMIHCIVLHYTTGWSSLVLPGPPMSPVVRQSDPAATTCTTHKEFLVATLHLVINEPTWSYSVASFAKF